jgi:hypothetical protein
MADVESALFDSLETGLVPASPGAQPPPPQPAPPPPQNSAVSDASLDDQSITGNDFTLYKGRKGIVDRIFILNPKSMKSARSHYQENKGYFLCHSRFEIVGGQEVCTAPAICCQKLDESKKRFAALILQYTVGPDGKLVNPLSFTMKLWRISDDRFVMLRDIHNEFPLDKHDLTIRTTEESFQKMTIQASSSCIVLNPKFPAVYREQIAAWVKAMTPKAAKSLGRQLSEQELRERLGVAVTPSVTVSEQPVVDVNALLEDLQ